jgi:ATP-dependent Clp protease ATP-binding subunit ClpX
MFELEDVTLKVTEEALVAIAREAILRNVGARGLRVIMEELMLELMYNIPSDPNVEEVVITQEVVEKRVQPMMGYKKQAG